MQYAIRRTLAEDNMPVNLTWNPKGLDSCFHGICYEREVMDVFEAMSSNPNAEKMRYALLDYRGVTEYRATQTHVEDLVALDIGMSFYSPHLRIACVTKDPKIESIWEYFKSLHETSNRLNIFSSIEAAQAWIAEGLAGA